MIRSLLFFLFIIISTPAYSQEDRYASIVMDANSGEILHEENANEQRYPASITKIMTLYLLFDRLHSGDISLDDTLTASRNASNQPPTRMGLRRGSTITVDEAIRAICVMSANDAAVLVAERIGGSESRFAALMTHQARSLDMLHTNFTNATGLPNSNNYSTAHDIAILSRAIWRDYPEYYRYFSTPSFSWHRSGGRNHNHLLGVVPGLDGLKTGYIRSSGFNLTTMTERNGRRIIVVVLGGNSASSRDAEVQYLINQAFVSTTN